MPNSSVTTPAAATPPPPHAPHRAGPAMSQTWDSGRTSVVLGIDPSLTALGWAHGDAVGVSPHPTVIGDARLVEIHRTIADIARSAAVTLAVVEDLPTHGQGAGKTGMAQGVVRLALLHAGVPYVLVPPASLKKFATGRGNATKPDMRLALYKRTGIDMRDDNCVDARWLAEMGLHASGCPSFELPKDQVAVVDRIAWPLVTA